MRRAGSKSIIFRCAREPIESLEGTNGELTKIVFKSGPELARAGLFFSTGCHQASDLSKRLGCERGEKGESSRTLRRCKPASRAYMLQVTCRAMFF